MPLSCFSGDAACHLTPAGREFAPIVEALGVWGQRRSRRKLEKHEIDLGLLARWLVPFPQAA